MIKINLLPVKAAKKKEKILNQLIVAFLLTALVLAVIGWRYLDQQAEIKRVKNEIAEVEGKIQKLRDAKKKYEELVKKSEILDRQLGAISQLDAGRDWFIRVFDKISESVPRNQVWVESLTMGGGRRRGGRGGGGSDNSINLQGGSYDRDAVAHFMGNLSIISCDDEKPEEEKAEICIIRNERCRSWDEEERNWKWDFEGCRRFYKNTCEKARECGDEVKSCISTMKVVCQNAPDSKKCKEARARCDELEKECENMKQDCSKLFQKQYIDYDSINLGTIKLKSEDKFTGVPVFSFDLGMQMTQPPAGK